ncbi:hypothetical protein RBI13_05290 [Alcaligenaceae bacterium A4P071]|nr:hypothetical protein [Alcaligenaceae bacterium A4P071]
MSAVSLGLTSRAAADICTETCIDTDTDGDSYSYSNTDSNTDSPTGTHRCGRQLHRH